MLTVWGRKTSSNVQAVMWCIGELGLEYKRHDVGHQFGGLDTAEFGKLNPNRTVPVVQEGSNPPIWETGAILRDLAGRHGEPTFWPAEPVPRAEVDMWAEWAKINVAMAFTGPVFWRVVRTPEAERDWSAICAAVEALENKLRIAETRLTKRLYLTGTQFTLADIQFGHVLYRYFGIDVERSDFPALRNYYERLMDRPAYREHVMVEYEELRET